MCHPIASRLLLGFAISTGSCATAGEPPADGAAHTTTAAPSYPPSSLRPQIVDITTDAYGEFSAAPRAPRLGARIEDFELPTMDGKRFSLAEARARGPVALVFFRGFW